MRIVFLLSFGLGMVMLFLALVRTGINGVIEISSHDTGTTKRKRKNKSIRNHWIITIILFVIAYITQYA